MKIKINKKSEEEISKFFIKLEIFILRFFNITRHEWDRVLISWILKFFLQVTIVLSGTLLTAFFVEKFHIENLPYLFISQSLAMIVGVIIFSPLAEKTSREKFITSILAFSIAAFLGLLSFQEHSIIFFILFIFLLSVLLAQVAIILSIFIEELFSPLESERTFPIVESSEPIGSLAAGVFILIGLHFTDVHNLLIISTISVVIMILVISFFSYRQEKIPTLKSTQEKKVKLSKVEALKESVKYVKIIPFLRILALLVFLQFTTFYILEFQFTKAVDEYVSHQVDDHGSHNSHDHASMLTHGLGTVHVFISLILLFSQLFIFSKILKKNGVAGSIALYTLSSTFSFIVMAFNFTFFTAVGSKMVLETMGALFRNAHQISFFALREKFRTHAKEFLEGIARPLGGIFGTLIVLILYFFLQSKILENFLNIILVILGIVMLFLVKKLSQKHTLLARKNLEIQGTSQEKLDAIEVLAQKGHKNASEILIKELTFRKDSPEVKARILKTLGILKDINALPVILKSFEDQSDKVKIAAINALSNFENLGEHFLTQSFAKFKVTESLKKLFLKTNSKKIKAAIMHAFAKVKNADIIPFLLEILDSEDENIKAEGIFACGLFRDPAVCFYLEKFLNDPSPRIKSNAIIALWQFVHLRLKLIMNITELIESKKEEEIMSGVFVIGEIKLEQERNRLLSLLNSENDSIRKHAAIALGKINHENSIEHILDFIWQDNTKDALKTKDQIKKTHPQIYKKLLSHIKNEASKKILNILKLSKTSLLEELNNQTLEQLLHIFMLIEDERRILQIKEELEKRARNS